MNMKRYLHHPLVKYRHRPRGSRSPLVLLILVIMTAAVGPAHAYPPECQPLGPRECTSVLPGPWRYVLATCGFRDCQAPENIDHASETSMLNALRCEYQRDNQCNLDLAPQPYYTGQGPLAIWGCGVLRYFDTLPRLHYGVEVLNFRPVTVTVVSRHGDDCQPPVTHETHLRRERALYCPPGMRLDSQQGYCYVHKPACLGRACCERLTAGNPISVDGNKFQADTDYRGGGVMPLRFTRYYNSGGRALTSGGRTLGAAWTTRLGPHWRHDYDRAVVLIASAALTTAFVYRPDGRLQTFNRYQGRFLAPAAGVATLERLTDGGQPAGWRYTGADDQTERYDADGRLLAITDRAGRSQTLGYDAAGRLHTVTGPAGRQLRFGYDGAGRLSTLTTPAGAEIHYSYDSAGRLASVTQPDATVHTYHYNEPAHRARDLPYLLTGITDENGERYATWQYDAQGRAVYSAHGPAAEAVTLSFDTDTRTTVTELATGQQRMHTFEAIAGAVRCTSITEPCPDCTDGNTKTTTYTYDANGFLRSMTEAVQP